MSLELKARPNPQAQLHDRLFSTYVGLYQRLKETMHALREAEEVE